ncbi:Uncharacterised protein [Yersinia pseudotuberculosis]|uniref:Uncharacterized protein n=1 Tax=Yersinia pseudotuberculosis TaxID=633 RepID=A0A380Q7J7_YERPU|nr:Uncharacterised protein [Yersinia pseudotuberculosis]CNF64189.1 Uncharacterised protein [Yersinia pseudotuberculosis]SUP81861.1 Uncharacterised protein [Yersinia pseudotuberculosis]
MNKCDYANKKNPDKVGVSFNCQELRASALPMDCHRSYCFFSVNTQPMGLNLVIHSRTLAAYHFTRSFCVSVLTTVQRRFAVSVAGRASSGSCSYFRSLTWNF